MGKPVQMCGSWFVSLYLLSLGTDGYHSVSKRVENSQLEFELRHPNEVNFLVHVAMYSRVADEPGLCTGVIISKHTVVTSAFCGHTNIMVSGVEEDPNVGMIKVFQNDTKNVYSVFTKRRNPMFKDGNNSIENNEMLLYFYPEVYDKKPFAYTSRPLCAPVDPCITPGAEPENFTMASWKMSTDGLNKEVTFTELTPGSCATYSGEFHARHKDDGIKFEVGDLGSPVLMYMGQPEECVLAILSSVQSEVDSYFMLLRRDDDWINHFMK